MYSHTATLDWLLATDLLNRRLILNNPPRQRVLTATQDLSTMTDLQINAGSGSRYINLHHLSSPTNLKSSIAKQSGVSIFRLPGEIRNMVYAYALGGNTWTVNMSGGRTKPRADNATKNGSALLQVNRQIYAEAHLFPYRYNTFEGRHNGHLQEWTQSLTAAQRESITCVKHSHRGYLVQIADSVDVTPTFWMDTPSMMQWKLTGLEHIVVEVALHKWGWDIDEGKAEVAKDSVLAKLRRIVEEEHPGVVVDVALRHGY